jgi:regulatory protein
MQVTRVRPDPRASDCVIVDVDGARFAAVPVEAAKELGLAKGTELDEARRARLAYLGDVEGAKRVALRLLALRPRSVQEMLRKLRERGHNPSAVAEVVGRLEEQGLLDDAAFAEHFARVRSARGHGRGRLLSDLLARGVDRRVAERAIEGVLAAEGVDELEAARQLALKRIGQLKGQPREVVFRRVVAYLARRGYRGREAHEAVRALLTRGS